jgi:hypothetical protein
MENQNLGCDSEKSQARLVQIKTGWLAGMILVFFIIKVE